MKNVISLFILVLTFAATLTAQNINQQFFNEADQFFSKQVKNGLLNYASLKNNGELSSLIKTIENANLETASDATKKAFYINAYNLHVINAATQLYPLNSVQGVGGFFDRKKITVGGETLTLNKLEKSFLLAPYQDARLHFVLVCGALGCPPITNFAYQPNELEQQLDQQTRLAINNNNFIKATANEVQLSQIFKWYASDFGGGKNSILSFINKYRNSSISTSVKVSYYEYDWTLNDSAAGSSANLSGNNANRYIVSSVIPKGSIEVKLFNNLYSQKTGSENNLTDRATFFTNSLSFLYGLNNRLNIGFSTRFRSVRNDRLPSSPLAVLGNDEGGDFRRGLTAFGPQIRYAPNPKWKNFSIQSALVFPIGKDLAGSADQPYIDWNGPTFQTQFFNDFSIGNNFSLFTEVDILLEDIGSLANGHNNRISTPATLIFSYNPNQKTTLYALGGFSPYWSNDFDYFTQAGIGAKYQFTSKLELELLFTDFSNRFLNETGGQAATYNIGLRFNL